MRNVVNMKRRSRTSIVETRERSDRVRNRSGRMRKFRERLNMDS